MNKYFKLLGTFLTSIFLFSIATYAQPIGVASLSSEVSAIQPGRPFTTLVQIKLPPEWHTYWKNPGDTGFPITIQWTLPKGFSAGPIQWPAPEIIQSSGLINYGYKNNEAALLVQITPPQQISTPTITLQADVDWLVCEEVCIPESATLSLTLPIQQKEMRHQNNHQIIHTIRENLPLKKSTWDISLSKSKDTYSIHLSAKRESQLPTMIQFIPYANDMLDIHSPQILTQAEKGTYMLTLHPSKTPTLSNISGILVSNDSFEKDAPQKALEINLPLPSSSITPLILIILGAFVGGIILNLMPCVLPIIGLKVMSFAKEASESRTTLWRHGLVFSFGILLSFWSMAFAILGAKSAGMALGWG
ncbi:MAG: hypothetical protein HRT90_09775, partial [Candidatus Margulisbacteria bacterium]|nr:hypothetical protein [Candidatus Margulisiibacteriota bacterium]